MRSEVLRLRCGAAAAAAALSDKTRHLQGHDEKHLGHTGSTRPLAASSVPAPAGATASMGGETAACDELFMASMGNNSSATPRCAVETSMPESKIVMLQGAAEQLHATNRNVMGGASPWPATQGAHARPKALDLRRYTKRGECEGVRSMGCAPALGAQPPNLCVGCKNSRNGYRGANLVSIGPRLMEAFPNSDDYWSNLADTSPQI